MNLLNILKSVMELISKQTLQLVKNFIKFSKIIFFEVRKYNESILYDSDKTMRIYKVMLML